MPFAIRTTLFVAFAVTYLVVYNVRVWLNQVLILSGFVLFLVHVVCAAMTPMVVLVVAAVMVFARRVRYLRFGVGRASGGRLPIFRIVLT